MCPPAAVRQPVPRGSRAAFPRFPPLVHRAHIGMPDQCNVTNLLRSHHADQSVRFLPSPETYPVRDLPPQCCRRHVRIVPAVRRNHAPIGFRSLADHGLYRRKIRIGTAADHRAPFFVVHPFSNSRIKAFANCVVSGACPCSSRNVMARSLAPLPSLLRIPARYPRRRRQPLALGPRPPRGQRLHPDRFSAPRAKLPK
jgi:hypothetical protein